MSFHRINVKRALFKLFVHERDEWYLTDFHDLSEERMAIRWLQLIVSLPSGAWTTAVANLRSSVHYVSTRTPPIAQSPEILYINY